MFFSVKPFIFAVRFFNHWRQVMFWFFVFGDSNLLFVYRFGESKFACFFYPWTCWTSSERLMYIQFTSCIQRVDGTRILTFSSSSSHPKDVLLDSIKHEYFFYVLTLLLMITFWFLPLKSTIYDSKEFVQLSSQVNKHFYDM